MYSKFRLKSTFKIINKIKVALENEVPILIHCMYKVILKFDSKSQFLMFRMVYYKNITNK